MSKQTMYNDGFYGKCEGCGSDGLWSVMAAPDECIIIQCECGQTVEVQNEQ